MTRRIEDRNLLCMQEANALMARLDRFFRDVHDRAAVQGLAIFLDKKVGLCLRPKVVVDLADHVLPRPAEQVFTCAVEPHEPQRLALLHEQHDGNVVDDGVEGCVGSLEFFLDALAHGDVHDRGDPADHMAGGISVRRIHGVNALELTLDGQFVFELNALATQHLLDAGANDLECLLAQHLHNRPADNLFQRQPDHIGRRRGSPTDSAGPGCNGSGRCPR